MMDICSTSGTGSRPTLRARTVKAHDDTGLSFLNFDAPPDHFLFISGLGQPSHHKKSSIRSVKSTQSEEPRPQDFTSDASLAISLASGSLYPARTSLLATNAHSLQVRDTVDNCWIPPSQTRSDAGASPYDSHASGRRFSADDHTYSKTSTVATQWSCAMDMEPPTNKRRRVSNYSQTDSSTSTTGRRRTSENAEPGSARAVYLEKNRHAASKCRTKQKRQQDDLVETSRQVENKNKVLKSEVEFLKNDLRSLMELVGKHTECADGRLRNYIQLEADRLATQGNRNSAAESL